MTPQSLCQYLASAYGAQAEYLWADSPDCAVFRHVENRKWFAVLMEVSPAKLGLSGSCPVAVVNVKAEPLFAELLRQQRGIFPAYHMNKTHWVTLLLSGGQTEEQIKALIDISYALTAPKARKRSAK